MLNTDMLCMNETSKPVIPTVIIADDAPDIRMILQRTLEVCDCKVVATAEDGEQAIELLEQHKPDMIFIDIEMPKINGLEVLEAINDRHIDVYSIIISGHSSKENFTAAIQRGAKGFIVKPHNNKKVEDIIADYLVKNKK